MDARRSIVTRASLVEDNGSPITSSTPDAGARIGEVKRVTKETNVAVRINLDGLGIADSSTGIPFLDHMLDQLASHGLFDVHVRATGDIHNDDHHTNEDVALAIGSALLQGLGDRKGINRFGDFSAPLDEALIHVSLVCYQHIWFLVCVPIIATGLTEKPIVALCVVFEPGSNPDLSGRPHLSYDLHIPTERVGTYDTQLVEHFFQSLVNTSGMTLHIRQLAGKNSHHIIEATFKAFARALRQATEYDPRRHGTVPRFETFSVYKDCMNNYIFGFFKWDCIENVPSFYVILKRGFVTHLIPSLRQKCDDCNHKLFSLIKAVLLQ
ncbi:hypothetical protein RHGRI_007710 [Rhododendron griersonianum]|uniref:imidazoleglycerol-phosphate dehydratase n=1 Tax=Rhododendron griersonianum TaxID=479676 RepID=A0AAV6KXY1_9ERIC|nr:hypothetical protein RHGRI_007710 [Rhododendron griersonianum]